MRTSMLTSTLLLASFVLLAHSVRGARDPSCDDRSDLSPSCGFIDPDSGLAYCQDAHILAIRRGCFVCVDPQSCHASNQEDPHEVPVVEPPKAKATASEARMMPSEVELSPVRDEHAGEQVIPIHAQQAAVAMAVVPPSQPAMQEVSDWYFLIPALLALVSVGIAVRGRIIGHGEIEFERVDGDDQEEINPFCADPACSPQQGAEDLEYGKPAAGDDSEDEASHTQL